MKLEVFRSSPFGTRFPRLSEVNGAMDFRETASSAQNAHWRISYPMDEESTDRLGTWEWEAATSIWAAE